MSPVTPLCADRPLPLYEAKTRRTRIVQSGRHTLTIEEDGFSVQKHEYYLWAVNDLCLTMKPYPYELDLRATECDVTELQAYLRENLCSGEAVEIWHLWVGDNAPTRLIRFSGALEDLDLDTLEQLEEDYQTCMTITI